MSRFKLFLAGFGGVFFSWLGAVWETAALTFIAMLLDYVTGILAGRANEGLNSSRAVKGLYKKVGLFSLLCTGFFLDGAFNHYIAHGFSFEMPFSLPIGLCVSVWITLTEAISVCENVERLGVRIPTFILRLLKSAREDLDKDIKS